MSEKNKKIDTALAMTLDISKFKNLCRKFSPEIAIMVRGRHGIGKSQVVYQVAELLRDDFYKSPENCAAMLAALKGEPSVSKKLKKSNSPSWNYEMGLPVIERRLSQMTEGDIIGLPLLDGHGTEFRPVLWLINGCLFPVVLFLDELNRAIKGVEQATFQLADSKAFYGNLLNSGTRIYIAINIGASYTVEEFDPAAISRYAVIDLEPSVDEFLAHSRERCNPLMPEFIAANRSALEHREENFEPNKKYPDRRAWVRLDEQLTYSGLYDTPNDVSFLHMAASMVGFHYGNMYWDHVKNNQFSVTGEEIAKNWMSVRKRVPTDSTVRQQKFIEMSNRVGDYLKDNKINTDLVGPQLKQFFTDCPAECVIVTWNIISKNKANFYGLHPHVSDIVIQRTTGQTINANTAVPAPMSPAQNPIIPRQRK